MSKKGLHNKNSIKINSYDDNNIINNNHNKKIVSIDVNIIYFTHSRIRPIFTGCNKLISDTLHEIVNGKISIKNIPLITIIESNGNYFSLNNRRLYLFKMLAEMNLLDNNDNTVLHNNTDVMSSNQNMILAYYKKASHKEKLKYIVNNYTLHAKLMSSPHEDKIINNTYPHDDDGSDNNGDSYDCNGANNNNKNNDVDKTLSGTINIDPRRQSEENIIGDDIDHEVVDVDIIISTSLLTTINNLTITANSGNYDTSSTVISTTTSTDDDIDKDDDNISNSNANFTTTTTTSSSFSISKSKYEKNKKLYNNNDNNSNINNIDNNNINNSSSNDNRSNNAVGDQKGKETIKYNNVFVKGNSKIVNYNDDNRIMRNILSIPIIKKEIKNIDKLILKGKINVVRSILDDWIVNNIINDEQYCYLCRQYNIL